jgi:hypothetical protein
MSAIDFRLAAAASDRGRAVRFLTTTPPPTCAKTVDPRASEPDEPHHAGAQIGPYEP